MKYAHRSIYSCADGMVFLAFDFSQAETWVVAHLANEQRMKDALKNSDIHTLTASVLFDIDFDKVTKEPRYVGKRYNHASSYRMSYLRAAEVINADSDKPPFITVTYDESKKFSQKWHSFYNVKDWWKEIEEQLSLTRTLTTPYGFRRQFFAPWGDSLFKEATAFVPQSTVADHAVGAVQKELGIRGGFIGVSKLPFVQDGTCKLVNTSHDSIMLEVPKPILNEIAGLVYTQLYRPLVVKDEMFKIPVDCEIGERWGEMEKVKLETIGVSR